MDDRKGEEDQRIEQIRAESEARGEIRVARQMILELIEERFPELAKMAQQQLEQIDSVEELTQVNIDIALADDEAEVYEALGADLFSGWLNGDDLHWIAKPRIQDVYAGMYAKSHVESCADGYAELCAKLGNKFIAACHDRDYAHGLLLGYRGLVLSIVEKRFPALLKLARRRAKQLDSIEKLSGLISQIAIAPDEAAVREALSTNLPGDSVGRG